MVATSKTLDQEIREHLSRLLDGQLTLRAFEDWFVSATWDVHLSGNPMVERLAYRISHRLSEFANGDWTTDDLRQLLAPLVSSTWNPSADEAVMNAIESPRPARAVPR